MISHEIIAEIRAALEAATPEPWYRHERDLNYIYSGQKIVGLTQSDRTSSTLNDAILICLLRNHTPALLDEIERLRAELDRITNDRNNQLDRLRAAAGDAERLRARVAELEAVRPTRCPRDFDATPRDYTGKTDGMSAELEARPKQCRWHITNEDEYPGVYTAECGHMFSFDEGDRAENDAVYCQYCGGKIVEDAQ